MDEIREILDLPLLKFGHIDIRVYTLMSILIFTAVLLVVLKVLKKTIYRLGNGDISRNFSLYTIIKYVIIVIYFFLILDMMGVNFSIFLAGSAALMVGVGIGLQNLFNDFVSGIILLFDNSIKVKDILEVNGMICRVNEIKLRTTIVQTRNERNIILPNSELTKSNVVNYTYNNKVNRFEIMVGVAYNSNIDEAMSLMIAVAEANKKILQSPKPIVAMSDFSESSVALTLYFYTKDIFRIEHIKSEIRKEILTQFRENKVEIPFPQRVVYTVNKN